MDKYCLEFNLEIRINKIFLNVVVLVIKINTILVYRQLLYKYMKINCTSITLAQNSKLKLSINLYSETINSYFIERNLKKNSKIHHYVNKNHMFPLKQFSVVIKFVNTENGLVKVFEILRQIQLQNMVMLFKCSKLQL